MNAGLIRVIALQPHSKYLQHLPKLVPLIDIHNFARDCHWDAENGTRKSVSEVYYYSLVYLQIRTTKECVGFKLGNNIIMEVFIKGKKNNNFKDCGNSSNSNVDSDYCT